MWTTKSAIQRMCQLGPDYAKVWETYCKEGEDEEELWTLWIFCGNIFINRYLNGSIDEVDEVQSLLEEFLKTGDEGLKRDVSMYFLVALVNELDNHGHEEKKILFRFGNRSRSIINSYNEFWGVNDRY